jgi:hypothetical protein
MQSIGECSEDDIKGICHHAGNDQSALETLLKNWITVLTGFTNNRLLITKTTYY